MSRRARWIWIVAGSLAALVLMLALSAVLVLRSDWFREKIRQRIVAEVEKATGGRTEIGAFQFDWKQMRAEVDGFVLHGSEPPDAPPLFRADAIVFGIKVISVLKHSVDLAIPGCAASADLRDSLCGWAYQRARSESAAARQGYHGDDFRSGNRPLQPAKWRLRSGRPGEDAVRRAGPQSACAVRL